MKPNFRPPSKIFAKFLNFEFCKDFNMAKPPNLRAKDQLMAKYYHGLTKQKRAKKGKKPERKKEKKQEEKKFCQVILYINIFLVIIFPT